MLQVPYKLTREYILSHPEINFVHSRCYWPAFCAGPCELCKGLNNCYGIPVRWKYCKSSGYFSDSQRESIIPAIDKAIEAIPCGDKPIVLFPKIGNGNSRMHIIAPICWQYMMDKLNAIKSQDYTYVYNT